MNAPSRCQTDLVICYPFHSSIEGPQYLRSIDQSMKETFTIPWVEIKKGSKVVGAWAQAFRRKFPAHRKLCSQLSTFISIYFNLSRKLEDKALSKMFSKSI